MRQVAVRVGQPAQWRIDDIADQQELRLATRPGRVPWPAVRSPQDWWSARPPRWPTPRPRPLKPTPRHPALPPDMTADQALAIIDADYDTGAGGGQLSNLIHQVMKLRSQGF